MMISFMNGVARCYEVGLPLAALARLGGAVAKSPPREARDTEWRLPNR